MMTIAQVGSFEGVSPAAVVLSGRRSRMPQKLAKAAMNTGCGSITVIRGGGRRRGAPEALVSDLLGRGVRTVVVSSLGHLHPQVGTQLAILATLLQNQIRVLS